MEMCDFPMKVLHFLGASAFLHFPWPPVQSFSVQNKSSVFFFIQFSVWMKDFCFGNLWDFPLIHFFNVWQKTFHKNITYAHVKNKNLKPHADVFRRFLICFNFDLTRDSRYLVYDMVFHENSFKPTHKQWQTRGKLEKF